MEKRELYRGVNGTYATFGGHIVDCKRSGNDIYGNPLYKIYPVSFSFRRLKSVYKNYASANYYLVQSYNIEQDLVRILDEIESILPLPENWERAFDYYEKIGYTKKTVKF